MNGINAGLALQGGRHLAQTIRRAIQNEYLCWLGKTVDQRLVVGDAAIDEDDALWHGVVPHMAACFCGLSDGAVFLVSPTSSYSPMRTNLRKRPSHARSLSRCVI